MYLTSMSDEEKDEILSKMFADLIAKTSTDANPVTLDFIKKTINEDDIFCTNCGNKLNHEWKCSNCGSTVNKDDTFCFNCGNKI